MENQPQKAEFRNNPENFHPCILSKLYIDNQDLWIIHRLILFYKFSTERVYLLHSSCIDRG